MVLFPALPSTTRDDQDTTPLAVAAGVNGREYGAFSTRVILLTAPVPAQNPLAPHNGRNFRLRNAILSPPYAAESV
jgi:hypothetical protein